MNLLTILSAFTFTSGTGLIGVLINLLILLLILSLVYYIITLLPLPPLFLRIAQIILAIILILFLASMLTSCSMSGQYTDAQGRKHRANYTVEDGKQTVR